MLSKAIQLTKSIYQSFLPAPDTPSTPPGAKGEIQPEKDSAPSGQTDQIDYNKLHTSNAARLVDIEHSSVLVVGANTGEDCREFIDLGASRVDGLDVIDEVGAAFTNERTTYYKQSIERTNLQSNQYDLIFSFATMEHVTDIHAGFTEMARLLKPGGVLYSIAAPLWNSAYGHHMTCFHGHPWVHLVFDRSGILSYANQNGIQGERGHDIVDIVDYMLDLKFFNKRSSAEYLDAAARQRCLSIARNDLEGGDPTLLNHPLGQAVLQRYRSDEILPVVHTLIATKTA
ncbi:class I SAM-dependent methyltransferase [Rhodopseudomonas sp. BR0C11]|uniref:class I SAM-dependent methyltransferase n=1 Tax=Rhodopseudomonas sp. BR0C11 TaxID=2269370 RepID=UPI0013DF11AC|nr:class I SAM-dependent methyltransferase [Rhodopseudomonas sp. BR0C11]NEV77984.1 class I SAM-dependent methyltransferase [Rhodopseudomonas sp. BR0C11]